MRYTVVWCRSARVRLADLWVQGPDRQAIADAANRIDRELQDDPHRKGTPWGRFYAFFYSPLAVLYEVNPGDCMVTVIAVRRTN